MTKRILLLFAIVLLSCAIAISQEFVNDSTTLNKGKHKSVTVTKTIDTEIGEEAMKLVDEGMDLANKGKYDRALLKLHKALELESNNVEILSNIGIVENLNGNTSRAEQYLERAWLASDSSILDIGVNLGLAYYNNGSYKKSIEINGFILSKASDQMTLGAAYFNRSMTYAKLGECDLGQNDFKSAKEIYKSFKSAKIQLDRLKDMLAACNNR